MSGKFGNTNQMVSKLSNSEIERFQAILQFELIARKRRCFYLLAGAK
jgi:hypothetical protein